MIALIFVRVPVAYSIGISAVVYSFATGSNPVAVIQRSVGSIDSFTLLAVPLFILVAEIMNEAGLTTILLDAALSWVGHFRGGLSFANVGINVVFAGLSGSGVADAAGVGKLLIPQMTRMGYPKGYSAALTASGAVIGPILPPSIPFIVYGLLAQVSVGRLFFAGIAPALMMAAALLIVSFVIAHVRKHPKSGSFSIKRAFLATWKSIPVLVLPLLIIGGLRGGVFTPTEAAAVAVVYAYVCSFFYTRLSFAGLVRALKRTALTTASITIIIAFADDVGWLMSVKQIPAAMASGLLQISHDPNVILVIIVIFLLIVGVFMESLSAMLIIVPVLAPAVAALGIDPVHFGVIVVLTLMLGMLTPPVGLVLYVVGAIAKIDAVEVAKANTVFFLALLVVLAVVMFAPDVVLAIPRWVMP